MIDDGHLLASSDADLHLQPQLHRRHPLSIDKVFKMLGEKFYNINVRLLCLYLPSLNYTLSHLLL